MVSLKEVFDLAFGEAEEAMMAGDVPVGAVIVSGGEIIASAHNEREARKSPTAHAEILAIEKASRIKADWRLSDSSIIVTLEPCVMCAGAIINARIKNIYFSALDRDAGACGGRINIFNKNYSIAGGLFLPRGEKLITDFFKNRRKDCF